MDSFPDTLANPVPSDGFDAILLKSYRGVLWAEIEMIKRDVITGHLSAELASRGGWTEVSIKSIPLKHRRQLIRELFELFGSRLQIYEEVMMYDDRFPYSRFEWIAPVNVADIERFIRIDRVRISFEAGGEPPAPPVGDKSPTPPLIEAGGVGDLSPTAGVSPTKQ